MAMVSERVTSRRDTIAVAIATELQRQTHSEPARVDIHALADAIETALAGPGEISEGRHPNELNASNDG